MTKPLSIALALLFLFLACTADQDYAYVGSVNSDKYHKPDCRWAKKIHDENRVEFKNRAEAEKADYKPCKVCRP